MKQISNALKKTPVAYVAHDPERALGLPLNTPGYFIISNNSGFGKNAATGRKNVLLITADRQLDTHELLEHAETKKFLKKNKIKTVLVFKNTLRIEKICAANHWRLLNPSAALANNVEEKVRGTAWLGELAKLLPPHKIVLGENLNWRGKKFIVQFNHAHTGNGTILIKNAADLQEIKEKFPKREIKVSEYIDGPVFTNNNVVWGRKILTGNISYQITGLKPFTNRPFATIGNDWTLAHRLLNAKQKKEYAKIARAVGNKLADAGWKGEFGIDVLMDNRTGRLYLIEINARQPASTSCETWLQTETRATTTRHPERSEATHEWPPDRVESPDSKLTTFEAHLLSLLGEKYTGQNLIKIKDGAQVVQKVMLTGKETPPELITKNATEFSKLGWRIIPYDHTELEQDWIRMQTKSGLLDRPGILNELGNTAVLFSLSVFGHCHWGLKRAGVVIAKDNKILLFRRHRFGADFFVVPGGRQDNLNESLKTTAIRELKEELNLEVELKDKKPLKVSSLGRDEYYFFAETFTGEPRLGGEELTRNSADNSYAPEWVSFGKLPKINLLPLSLKKKLIKILK